jgi:hypothetical protein
VARRLPASADGCDLVLAVSVLSLLFGLGLVGAGLAGAEPFPEAVATRPSPPASAVLPSTAHAPAMVTDRLSRQAACLPGTLRTMRSGSLARAPLEEDSREYLSKMTALRFRQRFTTPTALDPYQASLNLGLYVGDFTVAATPITQDRSPSPVLHDHRCWDP